MVEAYIAIGRLLMFSRSGEFIAFSSSKEERSFRVVYDLYKSTAKLYRRKLGAEAKELIKKWSAILNCMDGTVEDKTDFLADRIKIMLEHLDSGIISYDGSSKAKDENPIVEEYPTESLTELRAKYISQVMVYRDEKTLDSTNIRLLLEQQEQKPLFRSQVARVIKSIPKFLAAKIDIYAGKSRVVRDKDFFNTGPGLAKLRLGS